MFKKKEPKLISEFADSGIHMQELEVQRRSLKTNFFKCLWNAVLIFTFLFGHVGFFVYSFNLPCSKLTLMFVCLGISLYMSFLYLSGITFNIGYIALPFIVAYISLRLYRIVNSGFSAIRNLMIVAVDEKMNLPNTREFNEYVSNRYVSITACLAIISILLGIFINMWVSRRKSVLHPIVFTILLCEPAIYLTDENFSYPFLALIIVSIILFVLTKMNDSGEFIYKKKYRAYKIAHKTINLNKSTVSRRINLLVSVALVLVSMLAAFLICTRIPSRFFYLNSEMKDKTDEVVKNLAAYGWQYYFQNNAGNGGVDNGRIGSGTVVQDGETDLTIDFVPFSTSDIYLPMYASGNYSYGSHRWTEDNLRNFNNRLEVYLKNYDRVHEEIAKEEDINFDSLAQKTSYESVLTAEYEDFYTLSREIMQELYEKNAKEGEYGKSAVCSMRIKNVDLQSYSTDVYYTGNMGADIYNGNQYSRQILPGDNKLNSAITRTDYYIFRNYYPVLYDDDELAGLKDSTVYSNIDMSYLNYFVYDRYTEVPAEISYDINRVCKRQGFDRSSVAVWYESLSVPDVYKTLTHNFNYGDLSSTNSTKYDDSLKSLMFSDEFVKYIFSDSEKLAEEEFEIIEQVREFLRNDFIYTLAPGNVPYNTDPIVYFLTENKKGYCVYFASAAVMMLRNMGVPARYVEGYAFGLSDLEDAGSVESLFGDDYETAIQTNRTATGKNVDNYNVYEGYNALGLTSDDIWEIDVTDRNAHAWAEVYIYGFGWIPVEFTVARQDPDESESILSRLINNSGRGFFDEDTLNDVTDNIANGTTQEIIERGFKGSFVLIIVVAIALILIRLCRNYLKLYLAGPKKRAVFQYRHICDMIRKALISREKKNPEAVKSIGEMVIPHREFEKILDEDFAINSPEVDSYVNELLDFNYNVDRTTNEKKYPKTMSEGFRILRKGMKKYLPWYKRFLY